MPWVFPVITAGLVTFTIVKIKGICPPEPSTKIPPPPCPPIRLKHVLALLAGVVGAVVYFAFVGFDAPLDGAHFLNSQIAGFALGGSLFAILCPR
jgi:hypothetical protein